MAKALLGHLAGPDHRVVAEMRRLQQRIRDLETEIIRLRAANDALSTAVRNQEELLGETREPALT